MKIRILTLTYINAKVLLRSLVKLKKLKTKQHMKFQKKKKNHLKRSINNANRHLTIKVNFYKKQSRFHLSELLESLFIFKEQTHTLISAKKEIIKWNICSNLINSCMPNNYISKRCNLKYSNGFKIKYNRCHLFHVQDYTCKKCCKYFNQTYILCLFQFFSLICIHKDLYLSIQQVKPVFTLIIKTDEANLITNIYNFFDQIEFWINDMLKIKFKPSRIVVHLQSHSQKRG